MKRAIKNWLGIKEPKDYTKLKDDEIADIRKKLMDDVKTEIRHWSQTVERIGEIECTVCGKKIVTYPFGGGYYREADGAVICSNECLDKRVKSKAKPQQKKEK